MTAADMDLEFVDPRLLHEADPPDETAPGIAPWRRRGDKAVYEVNGRMWEVRIEPRCRTCSSPYRGQIEEALTAGHSAYAIAKALPDDVFISHDSISNHVSKSHLPLYEMRKWALIDQRANELGVDLTAEEVLGLQADEVTLSRMIVQRAQERIVSGEDDPSVSDGIAAAKLLREIEQGAGGDEDLDREAFKDIMMSYMAALVRHCSPEQVQAIRDDVYQHPVMVEAFGRLSGPSGSIGAG